MYDKIIDQEISKDKISNSLEWWENKRKLYNIVLVSISVILIAIDPFLHKPPIEHIFYDVIEIIIWIFGANIFYCLGLGFDLAVSFYRKKESERIRLALFVIGLIGSAIWTIVGITFNSFY